jgi:WD40 repeat protein
MALGPHEWMVGGISFSPDGKRICARRTDPSPGSNTVYLWDAETGNLVAKLIDHKTAVMVRFSLDGTLLATASVHPENLVRLWDTANGKLLHTLSGHANSITGLNFSPDGTMLATTSIDQTARLWDVKTGTEKAVLRGHSAEVSQVIFSPDGRRLVTQSLDDTMRLWNATNGDLIAVLREHTGRLLPALYTPDGSRLVSSSAADGTVRIWNLELLERNGILRGHTSFVYDVAFSPDGAQVASAGWDGTARLWDATTGRQTGLLQHERPWVTSLAYSRDGRTLATAVTGLGSMLWDLRTGKPQQVSVWKSGGSVDHGRVALSPDGRVLAYARHWVRLYDTVAKSQIAELPQQEIGVPEEAVFSPALAFSPDGVVLVTGAWDGTIRFWDTTTWQNTSVLRGHTGAAMAQSIVSPSAPTANCWLRDPSTTAFESGTPTATSLLPRLTWEVGSTASPSVPTARVSLPVAGTAPSA